MNSIDIPVHGLESNYMNIFDVVQAAHQHLENHDYEAAAKLYRNAADVGNQESQYHLALLLKEREVFSWRGRNAFGKASASC